MIVYLLFLVMAVFLGTEILAVSTPVAQVTLYRLLVFGGLGLSAGSLWAGNVRLKIQARSVATFALVTYLIWWLYALISGLWAASLSHWFRGLFLLTLGIATIVLLYFWVDSLASWRTLVQGAWLAMSALVLWGYYEIITNNYYLADLSKLDKYGTFTSQPWSRIPLTVFENQNDLGTMLLAYVAVSLSLYHLTKRTSSRLLYLLSVLLAAYLMYRTRSRMAFLGLVLYLGLYGLTQWKIDLKIKHWLALLATGGGLVLGLVLLKPSLVNRLSSLFYFGGPGRLSGDTVRVNLMRNGLLFLSQTWGFGVGAGNIEYWMGLDPFLRTETIINIHNWWFEILVSYGWLIFALYLVMYVLLMVRFYREMQKSSPWGQVARAWFVFLCVFIFASMTSANNLLIEWHWVIFGLMISLMKLLETRKDVDREFINHYA